ncbi:hypothetical protein KNE206_56070 [Kitasatospora sp. NE20-6]
MRAGAVTAAATLMMLMTSPVMAATPDDGDQPGAGIGLGEVIGLYVLLPIALFLIISGLVMLPSMGKGKKK